MCPTDNVTETSGNPFALWLAAEERMRNARVSSKVSSRRWYRCEESGGDNVHESATEERIMMKRAAMVTWSMLVGVSCALAQPTPSGQPNAVPPTPPSPSTESAEAKRGMMRTDALRLLSEADQFITNGQTELAFERLTTIKQKFMSVLDAEETNTVEQQFEQARSTLGLQVLADGRILPMTKDEDIDGLLTILPGSYATETKAATDANPALTYNASRVIVDGLGNSIYFEVARADDPANPFRQGVISFIRIGGKVRMRVMDIANPALREAIVGLWAAPETFPTMPVSNLAMNVELEVTHAADGSAYAAQTTRPFPIFTNGAVELSSKMRISSEGISIADRGTDANGAVIWGPASSDDQGTVFKKTAPTVKVVRQPGGLVMIDLIPGEAGGYDLGPGGDIALHFGQWTTTGIRMDSSRSGSRGPARVRYPVGAIAGLDQALLGITKGTRRRVVIPPELGYGNQPRGPIPGNSTLIFDLEVMWLQAPAAPEPAPAAPGVPEGPTAPSGPSNHPPAGGNTGGTAPGSSKP